LELLVTVTEDFMDRTARFRGELVAYCYRMTGSAEEAEDLVQETYLRAWRSRAGFEGRSSERTWLYRIATNVCLTALERRARRPLPSGLGGPQDDPAIPLSPATDVPWLRPLPDALLAAEGADPAAVTASRAGIRLAFVAALQYLSARQRAMLILRDVLEWPAADVAALLETTTTAVNSGLRRARAQLAQSMPAEDELAEPTEPELRAVLERFSSAFENADARLLAELLRQDAVLEMPPMKGWFAGRDAVTRFFGAISQFAAPGGFRMTPTAANGQPAFAVYGRAADGSLHLHGLTVLSVTKTGIARIVSFLDPGLASSFGLPRDYPPAAATAAGPAGLPSRPSAEGGLMSGDLRRIIMADRQISGVTALVTGASRGLGRGIAVALSSAGARVIGVARERGPLEELRSELGESFTAVTADAADPVAAGHLIDAYRPGILVLNAGASPLPRPIQRHTWETFSRTWDVDVKQAFHWTREALLAPLAPGSTVIALSSGAALRGSPLSGGYAGAKAAIRWLTAYAAEESARDALGIRFVSLLPQITPETSLGAAAVAAYAARYGITQAAYIDRLGGRVLTPDLAGKAVTDLITGSDYDRDGYLLTAAGLTPLP
jgi:RNA polymerase sigma-70 factor (ECF subfamily)